MTDLRRRLERLDRKPRRTRKSQARPLRQQGLPPGVQLDTPYGSAFRIETHYPSETRHGNGRLADLLNADPALAAEVGRDDTLREAGPSGWKFVDLETTGLVGGAGTIGFLVGVGSFEADSFQLRQYFLRDPEEEAAMLHILRADLEAAAGFVSFNGRSFDLPLLENRFTLAKREKYTLSGEPHLDLLYPARRLWSRSLPDCRLSTIEQHVLGVERSEEDVPGELIPGMYLDYLRTGDASDMTRVIYHNAIDILSLVGLSAVILERHRTPDARGLESAEALAVARWHQAAGRTGQAEAGYRAAVAKADDRSVQADGLRHLGILLKREGRRAEALDDWERWHRIIPEDPAPCIELAMYYEWEAKELKPAVLWADRALVVVERWPTGWKRDHWTKQINHRIARLNRKFAR